MAKKRKAHNYERAHKTAPAETKKLIEKFRRLPEKERRELVLLYYILGDGPGTPLFKMDKEDAAYIEETPTPHETCANCNYAYQKVVSGKFICSQIEGEIKPEAWCRLWEEKEMTKGAFSILSKQRALQNLKGLR